MPTLLDPPGVRSVVTSELATAIRKRHSNLLRELRITVVDGGVILHGHAYSFYGKQIAQHEVMHTAGLVVIANHIAVA